MDDDEPPDYCEGQEIIYRGERGVILYYSPKPLFFNGMKLSGRYVRFRPAGEKESIYVSEEDFHEIQIPEKSLEALLVA